MHAYICLHCYNSYCELGFGFFFLCVSTEKKVLETLIMDILTRHTNEKCRHDYSNTIHVRCPSEAMSVSQHAPNQSST